MAHASVAAKRQIVNALSPRYGSVRALCRWIGLAPSSYYHRGPGHIDAARERCVLRALLKLAGRHPTYGYRRLTKLLRRRAGFGTLNTKRVRRLLKSAGIQARKTRRWLHTTDSTHAFRRYPNLVRDLCIERPNQVWVCDLTYVILSSGEVVYLAIVLDVFTRVIRGWALGPELSHALTLSALRRALRYGCCEIHHSDQGVQYATPLYTELLNARSIQISMTDRGQAWQNGYAERCIRTLKEEEVYLSEYTTCAQAFKHIGRF
ncbi:MAG: IS3 family transposase, partial [Chloroflexi bacterium]|nr:IS3 family transposase [Chloroflexota bacterium]